MTKCSAQVLAIFLPSDALSLDIMQVSAALMRVSRLAATCALGASSPSTPPKTDMEGHTPMQVANARQQAGEGPVRASVCLPHSNEWTRNVSLAVFLLISAMYCG